MDAFRSVLESLHVRPGIQAVYAQISELDPGEECWPFTDTILVAATSLRMNCSTVSSLLPDKVGNAEAFDVSPSVAERHHSPVWAVWWD